MNLLYTNEARELIARKVPWIKGKALNYLTFQRLVEERLLPAVRLVERGQDVFDERAILSLIKRFPPAEPPRRLGLIRYLKGERTKKDMKKVQP